MIIEKDNPRNLQDIIKMQSVARQIDDALYNAVRASVICKIEASTYDYVERILWDSPNKFSVQLLWLSLKEFETKRNDYRKRF
jgi:hypothetical protein